VVMDETAVTEEVDGSTLQVTDGEISAAQEKSKLVRRLRSAGSYRGMKVSRPSASPSSRPTVDDE
jgi:hypothetical protein